MNIALFDAIITKFTTAGLSAAGVTGGVFLQQVPAGTAAPYLIVTPLPSPPLIDSYGNQISADLSVQMAVFGEGCRAVGVLMRLVTAAYDNTILTLSGKTNIGMYRLDEPFPVLQPPGESFKDQNSIDMWGWFTTYVYSVQ